jgi:hypothetical protein
MNTAGSFDRTLIDFNLHIRSVCRHCGEVIVGSATEGLEGHEANHLDTCCKISADVSLVKLKAIRRAA